MIDSNYNNKFIDWLLDRVSVYSHHHMGKYDTYNSYIQSNFRFITFNFNRDGIYERMSSDEKSFTVGQIQFNQFHHFYNLVCRNMLGRKFLTHPDIDKPLCLACLDANGSRYWKEMGEIDNIHLHTIWVLPPEKMSYLLDVAEKSRKSEVFDFSQIDIRTLSNPFDTSASLRELVSYTFKFDRFNQPEAEIPDSFRIYPLVKDGPIYENRSW